MTCSCQLESSQVQSDQVKFSQARSSEDKCSRRAVLPRRALVPRRVRRDTAVEVPQKWLLSDYIEFLCTYSMYAQCRRREFFHCVYDPVA